MTTEANNSDPRVSRAYRDLAKETSPPELDEKILKLAAGNVPTRYGLARGWLRPVAWAATIGLSLALVLEVSQYTEVSTIEEPATEGLSEQVVSDSLVEIPEDADLAKQVRDKRKDIPAPAKALAPRTEGIAPAAMESAARIQEFDANDSSSLPEAEEMLRMRASEPQSAASADEKKEQAEYCEAEARATATDWYECIETLRAEGLADAARQELDALLIEYPDYHQVDQNR